MRYIPIDSFTPSAAWLARAQEATAELILMTGEAERLDYIKRNADIWKEFGRELISYFGDKCWYTDAANYGARLDVEHFRPKARIVELSVDDVEEASDDLLLKFREPRREGYWWLAFDPENLLLCSQVMNRENKKNFFPLHRDSPVASAENRNGWRTEIPVFLDPRKLDDVFLVAYDDTGAMRPRADLTGWERLRVVVTNECFGLSRFQPLIEGRQRTWQKCSELIERYMRAATLQRRGGTPDPVLQQQKDDVLHELQKLIDPDEQFSSVAASCLRDSPHPWARALVSHPQARRRSEKRRRGSDN